MEKRRIYMGADAAGYPLKEVLKTHLTDMGYQVTDMGCHTDESCHYPLYAHLVCEEVQKNPDTAFGVLVCGTGIGMSMCANKHRGIRAALCSDPFSSEMTRSHNDANVICLGARVLKEEDAKHFLDVFLSTPFDGGERHQIRLRMMKDWEE